MESITEPDSNTLQFLGELEEQSLEFPESKALEHTGLDKEPMETCVEKDIWPSLFKFGEDGIEKSMSMKRDTPFLLLSLQPPLFR